MLLDFDFDFDFDSPRPVIRSTISRRWPARVCRSTTGCVGSSWCAVRCGHQGTRFARCLLLAGPPD